jgi:hypothetical protein
MEKILTFSDLETQNKKKRIRRSVVEYSFAYQALLLFQPYG